MKITPKEYKTLKIEKYLKKSEIFFLFNGLNKNSYNRMKMEQELKKITFNYYKIFNKTSRNKISSSIYKNLVPTINGITFFFEPEKSLKVLTKHVLLTNFKTFSFDMLAIKFNKQLYTLKQVKNSYSFNYKENQLIMYQFNLTNIKLWLKLVEIK